MQVYLNTDGKVLKLTNALFGLLFAVFCANSSYAQDLDARVIAHSKVNQETISERQLRRVFMLKQRSWEDGSQISLVVFSSEDEKHALFLRRRLKLFPYQLEREWNKLIYSGQSAPPIVATDTETMLQIVSTTPGAIGYVVSQSEVGTQHLIEDENHSIKTLKVIAP